MAFFLIQTPSQNLPVMFNALGLPDTFPSGQDVNDIGCIFFLNQSATLKNQDRAFRMGEKPHGRQGHFNLFKFFSAFDVPTDIAAGPNPRQVSCKDRLFRMHVFQKVGFVPPGAADPAIDPARPN